MSIQSDSLPVPVYILSVISMLNNIVLLYVYIRCPLKKIKSYKYFFLLNVVQGLLFSSTFVLDMPRVIAQRSFVIFISTGIVENRPQISFVLHFVFCMTYFVSVVLVTNSFVYRYLQVCRSSDLKYAGSFFKGKVFRPHFFDKLSTKKTLLLGVSLNSLVLSNIFAVVYIVLLPNKNFVQFVNITVVVPGVDIDEATFLGISTEFGMDSLHITLLAEFVLLLVSIGSINVYCAKKIKSFLKNGARSSNFLTLQRQMFALLLAQACCPLLFLVAPFSIAISFPFIGVKSTDYITNTISILIAMYPVFNPFIIIMFVKEYRTFVLVNLKLEKPSLHVIEPMFVGGRNTTETRRTSSTHI